MTTQVAGESPASVLPGPARSASVPSERGSKRVLVLMPAVALLIACFVYPLANIVWQSFTEPEVGFQNYVALFRDGVSVVVILRTLGISAIVTVGTVLVAFPYAYAMTRVSPRTRSILTIVVLMPFWTSVMARNFAWYLAEQRGGVIDKFFSFFGIEGVVLLGTLPGVTIAMIQVMLPFAVLPLYTSLSAIDYRLMDAANSCGATWAHAFRTIYLPLSRPGIVSALSLIMILSLGFYVTPAILGSAQQSLVAQLIASKVGKLLDFSGAGALGMILLVVTLVVLALVASIGRKAKGINVDTN